MGYSKLDTTLELVRFLQSKSIGATIEEIMEFTERSRATCYRMLEGIEAMGLEVETQEVEADHHRRKRYRVEADIPDKLLTLDDDERSALEIHLQTLPNGAVKEGLVKLIGQTKPLGTSVLIDMEYLIGKTAHTGNSKPRVEYDATQISNLEKAILSFTEVKFKYRPVKGDGVVSRQVRPLGLLFGRFAYLVASTGNRAPISYRLDLIQSLETTTQSFTPKDGWDLKSWSEQSFGVYHGDALWDIKIRFAKQVADRAEKVQFHPSQKNSHGRGGTLIVEMKCRGHRELIHELLQPDWVGYVEIESPERLKEEYLDYLERAKKAVDLE
jgi:predicted DNA-binding transcriptional regulator YafY